MIKIYFMDIIKIVNVKTDTWGVKTETIGNNISARVLDTNKLTLNDRGIEVMGSMKIMLPITTTILYDDKIKIMKRNGIDYELKDKLFQIHSISRKQSFTQQYIEVII
jgi:hypothetical protein